MFLLLPVWHVNLQYLQGAFESSPTSGQILSISNLQSNTPSLCYIFSYISPTFSLALLGTSQKKKKKELIIVLFSFEMSPVFVSSMGKGKGRREQGWRRILQQDKLGNFCFVGQDTWAQRIIYTRGTNPPKKENTSCNDQ